MTTTEAFLVSIESYFLNFDVFLTLKILSGRGDAVRLKIDFSREIFGVVYFITEKNY